MANLAGTELQTMRAMKGKTMAAMVHHRLAPPVGINPSYVPLDPAESSRNQRIAANMRKIAHVTNTTIVRMVLPNDGGTDDAQRKAQAGRQTEWMRQAAMPWGSRLMVTPTDTQRLNNPAQYSAVRQRQLTIPSSYGQFYSFMHAMAAAFGNLDS